MSHITRGADLGAEEAMKIVRIGHSSSNKFEFKFMMCVTCKGLALMSRPLQYQTLRGRSRPTTGHRVQAPTHNVAFGIE